MPPAGRHETLVKNGDNTWTLTRPDQIQYDFPANGGIGTTVYLNTITDPNGNTVTLSYDGSNRLTHIQDDVSRNTTFTYL